MESTLKEMEDYAKKNKICIVQPPTRDFLQELCAKLKPKRILEVGTAIGYSASCMLLACDAKITCAEASVPNIKLANNNFSKLGLAERVKIVEGDCIKTLPSLVGQKFDLIFLDGPKGLYSEIFELLLPLLDENGVFVADNVEFRKMVSLGAEISEPRFEKTVKALRTFIDKVIKNDKLDVEVFPTLGDGILVAKFKKEKQK